MNQEKIEKGKKELEGNRITIGLATCGVSAGGIAVYEALKSANLSIPVEKVGCIGMCYNEPLVTVNFNGFKSIYGKVTKENVDKLIQCIRENRRCEELFIATDTYEIDFYKKQVRIVMENCGISNPEKIEHYYARGGYTGLQAALKLSSKEVIDYVMKSGLRGRGGAGFPTGKKWSFIADKQGKKYLICNGDEGDPGAFMNRTLMESDPFKIIEGMAIGAYATGADEGLIYTRGEYPLATDTMMAAIKVAYDNNLLGKNIMGVCGFNFDLRMIKGAGAFVCGEETAMMNSIEGRRGQPNPRPPYPAEKGLFGKPTNVNNVETWGQVSSIFKIGVENYVKIGTEKTKGTKSICLTGKIKRTGVIEVPFGIKLREIVFDIGGGTPEGTEFKALLTGGPAGGSITKDKLDTPMDYETLLQLGSIMGSGGFITTNDKSCMINIAKFFLNFTQEESCGKCTPCREGTKRLLEMLTRVSQGISEEKELIRIKELAEFVRDNSLCGLGQNAPNPILSTLNNFKDEYLMHINDKKCPAGVCENLITFTIADRCVGCGNCKRNCPVEAITGNLREKHFIDQKKCVKCGRCFEVCAFNAIDKK